MTKHRIYTTSFASVYPHYVAKAEKKARTKAEVDESLDGEDRRSLVAVGERDEGRFEVLLKGLRHTASKFVFLSSSWPGLTRPSTPFAQIAR